MIHLVKHRKTNYYVKNVLKTYEDGKESIRIVFTEKIGNARVFKKYTAAKNLIEHYLCKYYQVITIQE